MSDFNLADLSFWVQEPSERHAAFKALRGTPGLPHFDEPDNALGSDPGPRPGFYAVTRHRDILEVGRKDDIYRSSPTSFTIGNPPAGTGEGSMISTDNPRHARLRRIVQSAYHPRRIAQLEASIDREAAQLVASVAGSGECDFVETIAAPYPLINTCKMMGIPPSEHATVLKAAHALITLGSDPQYGGPFDSAPQAVIDAAVSLISIMHELGPHRAEHPVDDVTSSLVNANVDGEYLTTDELGDFFMLLVIGGIETTIAALSNGLCALTEYPDQRQLWLEDPEGLAASASNEIVRWTTPAMWFRRTVGSPTVLSGTELVEGDKLMLLYASANRDEKAFTEPMNFNVARSPNPHVGFGPPGEHFCLGAHLSRREISSLFRELLRRSPEFSATAAPVRVRSNLYDGVRHLSCTIP